VFVDQEADPDFSATPSVADDGVVVTVTGEVDMSTADAMFRATIGEGAVRATTLDLRAVTFFDSAAIHALLRLAEHYGPALSVLPSVQVRRVLEISGLAGQPWLTNDLSE
jgi:anti-anti-sigma factor